MSIIKRFKKWINDGYTALKFISIKDESWIEPTCITDNIQLGYESGISNNFKRSVMKHFETYFWRNLVHSKNAYIKPEILLSHIREFVETSDIKCTYITFISERWHERDSTLVELTFREKDPQHSEIPKDIIDYYMSLVGRFFEKKRKEILSKYAGGEDSDIYKTSTPNSQGSNMIIRVNVKLYETE